MHPILVVEDDPLVRLHVCGALEDEGYLVLQAGSGREALDLISSSDTIRLIISDINLPGGINGLKLIREVKRRWPAIATVIASGLSDIDLEDLESTAVLRKTFGVSSLINTFLASLLQQAEAMLLAN